MRKNRLLMSLTFALAYGAVACGGADDGVTDFNESLKRGKSADGGSLTSDGRGRGDRDEDSDEAIDEASADGGRRHRDRDELDEERGDGGFCGIRGRRGKRGGRDHDSDDDDRGLPGPRLDGGAISGDRGDRGDRADGSVRGDRGDRGDRGGKPDGKGDADAGASAP